MALPIEVLRTRRAAVAGTLDPETIDTDVLTSHLESSSLMPPMDLLIRTSGEQRISNFFLWEIAYAELYFTETLWPDFRDSHLMEAIADYGRRERRFGLTSDQIGPLPAAPAVAEGAETTAVSTGG